LLVSRFTHTPRLVYIRVVNAGLELDYRALERVVRGVFEEKLSSARRDTHWKLSTLIWSSFRLVS